MSTILVVDDNATNRFLLRSFLMPVGHKVIECSGGQEGLDVCRSTPPDLVLLDLMMPGMDGLQTCKLLRESHSALQLPIIIVTAVDEAEALPGAIKLGANDYISKPINRDVLLARVQNQLRLRDLERKINERIRLESVALLVKAVSHNFNNILGGVVGALDVLERYVPDSERPKRAMSVVRRGAEAATALTRRLGILSEDGSGGNDYLYNGWDEMLDAVAMIHRERAERIKISVKSTGPLPKVKMNVPQLFESINQIVSNSIDAMPQGGTISIDAHYDAERAAVLLTFTDTGVGMDPDTIRRVFEPFFTTKNLDRRNEVGIDGRGLGLWTVYNLVRAAAGDISIKSGIGQGTQVVMTLPALQN